MKLNPSQIAMYLFLGEELPMMGKSSLSERIALGRKMLLKLSENNFGANAKEWHLHLMKADKDAYEKSSNHKDIETKIEKAAVNNEWRRTVKEICS